jgi:hypothetical protein
MTCYSQVISNFAISACQGCGGGTGGFYAYASGNTRVVDDLIAWTGTATPVALTCSYTAEASLAVAAGGNFTLNAPACATGLTKVSAGCRSANFNSTIRTIQGRKRVPD